MRTFSYLATFLLVAIGIGVGVEATQVHPIPSAVESAIERTIAVQSIEASIPGTGRFPGSIDSFYGARNEFITPRLPIGSAVTERIVLGDRIYFLRGDKVPGILRGFNLLRLGDVDGLTPAQEAAFGSLVQARSGTQYRGNGDHYSFRLSIRLGSARFGVNLTHGAIELSNGFVRSVTIDEVIGNRMLPAVHHYERFNSAPPPALPRHLPD